MTEPLVLTALEVAKAMRCSRAAVYSAIKRGDLPVVRVGRLLKVPKPALDRMLLNGCKVDQEGG